MIVDCFARARSGRAGARAGDPPPVREKKPTKQQSPVCRRAVPIEPTVNLIGSVYQKRNVWWLFVAHVLRALNEPRAFGKEVLLRQRSHQRQRGPSEAFGVMPLVKIWSADLSVRKVGNVRMMSDVLTLAKEKGICTSEKSKVFLQDWTELEDDAFGELLLELPFEQRVFIVAEKPPCKAVEETQAGTSGVQPKGLSVERQPELETTSFILQLEFPRSAQDALAAGKTLMTRDRLELVRVVYLDTPCRTILAGDFNCVLAERDCSKRLRADVSRLELRKLLRDFDLVDAKDNEKTADPTYTHWQGNCHARLDRIYLSGEFSAMTPVLEVLPLAFSDHALVTVTLGRPVPRTRKSSWWSSWKLNESLIEDEQLRTQIKELLEGKTGGVPMNAVTWEELKEDVKLKAFRHSQEKAARERAEKRRLMKTLEILIAEENRSPGLFSQDIRDCKGNILELLEKEYRGAMVRSRTLFLERDEEPSKIFKTKERQHAARNKIGKLQVGDVEVTRKEEIEDAFLQAYTDLFTRVEDDGVLQTTGVALPKISPKVRKQMNRKITASEVEEAIKELAPRKSPGVDGLGSQFYKTFSAQLCPILRDVYADVLKRGLLPPSMRQAVTVLIQKKNSKGTPKVDHFRPISLLTSDYKILAKILAKRLEWGLRDVVGEHQAYGIKRRTISTNLHAMRIVCEAAQVLKLPVAVLQATSLKSSEDDSNCDINDDLNYGLGSDSDNELDKAPGSTLRRRHQDDFYADDETDDNSKDQTRLQCLQPT
ncbi:hypothetical protein ISCGN_008075 [Ixodes scapularis]